MNVSGVTPQAVRRELLRLGFQEYETSGRAGVTWLNPQQPDGPTVLVPREQDHELYGYEETLASAVERLSWITEEPMSAVQMRLIGSGDRMEMRIVHQLTERNSLRALDAPRVMKGFVDLIKNGARTEFTGARVDHRGSGGPVYDEALAGIEVLAPAPGSFRLVAISAELPQLSIEPGGSVTKSRGALAATLRSLAVLSSEDRPANELDEAEVEELVDAGVSKQLLAAVDDLAIADSAGLQLEFTGAWDSVLGAPDAPTGPVVLYDAHVSLARALKDKLSPYEPIDDYTLIGWAETTKAADLSFEGLPAGSVVVRQRVSGRYRDVIVDLSSEVFPLVHAGISEIRATGTLERISGRWHLVDPRGIEIDRAQPPDSE